MVNKKILLFIPILIFLCNLSYAGAFNLEDNQYTYNKFDGNFSDATGNLTLTATGITSDGTGIIGTSATGFGSSKYGDWGTTAFDDLYDYGVITFNQWIRTNGTGSYSYVWDMAGYWFMRLDPSNVLGVTVNDAVNAITTSGVADGDWHMVTFTHDGTTAKLYLDSSFITSGTYSIYDIGVDSRRHRLGNNNAGTAQPFSGNIDEFAAWNRVLNITEIEYLYASGSPDELQQYPYEQSSPAEINDSIEGTSVVKQNAAVVLTNTIPKTITSTNFNITEDWVEIYASYTFEVESNLNNALNCTFYINGTRYGEVTRSNTANEKGNVQLMTSYINLTQGTYVQTLSCAKLSGPGQAIITDTVGISHFMIDSDGNRIPHNETIFDSTVTSGASYTLINSTKITISNQTTNPKIHTIVVEGAVTYENLGISAEVASLYADINGSNCTFVPRYVGSSLTGSVGYDCILENVTANQTYQLNIYGNGTNIKYNGDFIIKSFYMSEKEILGGTGIFTGLTFNGSSYTKLFNGTGGNLNHDQANAFTKLSYSILTDADTTVSMYINLTNGDTFISKIIERDFSSGEIGVMIGQDSFLNVPQDDYQIELWANCGGANCKIMGGSSLGYITDVITTIPNQFNITAWNAWNGSQILVFNASNGIVLSTEDGLIQYFTNEDFENITISSINYINQTFLNHDTTNIINTSLYQSNTYLNIKEKFSNNTINSVTLLADGNTINTNNGTLYLNPNLGNLSYTLNSSGYINISNSIEITELTNETLYMYNSITEINLVNASDQLEITNFNVTLSYNGENIETYETTNGSAYFNLTQNITYDITIDAVGFYSNSFTIEPNTVIYDETFELIKVGNLEIRVYDSADRQPITQLVNLTLTGPITQTDYNFTGGNFTLTGLSEATLYSLDFESVDYADASFLITYSEELAKDVFEVFMTKVSTNITFTVLETSGDVIQYANVQVKGFVNGTLETVAEKQTDGVGQVRFNLMPNEPYTFIFSKEDYITNTVSIITYETEYTITMQKVNVVNFDGPASNVLYNYEPKEEILFPQNYTFNWTVVPQEDAVLDEFGIEIYFNGSLVASNSLTTESGGLIQLTHNLTPYLNDSIQVYYYFIKENFTRYELAVNYQILEEYPEGSLLALREWIGSNVSERDKIITWFLITSFIGILIYLFSERNSDITTIGTIIDGAINIWLMNFATITSMIFISLIIISFIVYLSDKRRKGQL